MKPTSRALAALALLLSASCTFHTTATRWNGLYDEDGKPVFVKSTTNVGFNLGVLLPLAGNVTIDAMIDDVTAEIAAKGGDRVRLVQTGSENYWYGWSPFTWILTPVVTDVVVEFEPSKEDLEKAKSEHAAMVRRQRRRMQADNSHVIPDWR